MYIYKFLYIHTHRDTYTYTELQKKRQLDIRYHQCVYFSNARIESSEKVYLHS